MTKSNIDKPAGQFDAWGSPPPPPGEPVGYSVFASAPMPAPLPPPTPMSAPQVYVKTEFAHLSIGWKADQRLTMHRADFTDMVLTFEQDLQARIEQLSEDKASMDLLAGDADHKFAALVRRAQRIDELQGVISVLLAAL